VPMGNIKSAVDAAKHCFRVPNQTPPYC
jgi:hypothetical protein